MLAGLERDTGRVILKKKKLQHNENRQARTAGPEHDVNAINLIELFLNRELH